MKIRRYLLTGIVACCLAAGDATAASRGTRQAPYDIFVLTWRGTTESERGFMDYFHQRRIPVRFHLKDCAKDPSRIPQLVQEIARERPDLVYSFGTTLTRGVVGPVDATARSPLVHDIPVVFSIVSDPVGAGLVKDFSSSGRNLTGASHSVPLETQLKTFREIVDFERLGVLFNPAETNSTLTISQLREVAADFDFSLLAEAIRLDAEGRPRPDDIAHAIDRLAARRPQLVYLPSDSFLISNAQAIARRVHGLGIPLFSATESPVRRAGAYAGLVSGYYNVGMLAAYKAWQILVEGRRPADIPVERLKVFSFIINRHTMQGLHLYPPVQLLNLAEVVDTPDPSATAPSRTDSEDNR